MKLIIILLLFPFVTWGQNLFPSKGIRRTTTPNNGKFVDSPSFNSKYTNILGSFNLSSLLFSINMKNKSDPDLTIFHDEQGETGSPNIE